MVTATRSSRRVAARHEPKVKKEEQSEEEAEVKSEYEQDDDYEEEGEGEKVKEEAVGDDGGNDGDAVAEYERKRLANIQRNLAFMQSMGVSTAKIAARTAVAVKKPTVEKRKPRVQEEPAPRRKSRRLEGKAAELEKLATLEDGKNVDEPAEEWLGRVDAKLASTALNMSEERRKKFLESLAGGEEDEEEREEDLKVDASGVDVVRYELQERDVVKALPERVYSMAFHPRSDRMVLAVGDKAGNFALWSAPQAGASLDDASQADDVMLYRPHTLPITQLLVSPQDQTKLLTSSFDGSIREFDMRSGIFSELFATTDYAGITYLTPAGKDSVGVYYGSGEDGTVWRIDRREGSDALKKSHFALHEKKINTVHVQPNKSNTIVTASLDRTVCLWDARMLRAQNNKPVVTMPHHRSVNCAYYSPNGAHLVTVGQDNYVNLFDMTVEKYEDPQDVQPTIAIPHNNQTGRWLTKLHASWDPKRPDQFVIGCMQQPRRLQIFRATRKNPVQELKSDFFNSVHSVNVFHPHVDALAGGNSSGRLCLWRAGRSRS